MVLFARWMEEVPIKMVRSYCLVAFVLCSCSPIDVVIALRMAGMPRSDAAHSHDRSFRDIHLNSSCRDTSEMGTVGRVTNAR